MVRLLLGRPAKWTVQGFGMIRTYIPGPVYDKQFRLNVWDSRLRVPNVSVMHDHPWDMTSWIISGLMINTRYIESGFSGWDYSYMNIKTGEGGGPAGDVKKMRL
jgi:hypothetical protein